MDQTNNVSLVLLARRNDIRVKWESQGSRELQMCFLLSLLRRWQLIRAFHSEMFCGAQKTLWQRITQPRVGYLCEKDDDCTWSSDVIARQHWGGNAFWRFGVSIRLSTRVIQKGYLPRWCTQKSSKMARRQPIHLHSLMFVGSLWGFWIEAILHVSSQSWRTATASSVWGVPTRHIWKAFRMRLPDKSSVEFWGRGWQTTLSRCNTGDSSQRANSTKWLQTSWFWDCTNSTIRKRQTLAENA